MWPTEKAEKNENQKRNMKREKICKRRKTDKRGKASGGPSVGPARHGSGASRLRPVTVAALVPAHLKPKLSTNLAGTARRRGLAAPARDGGGPVSTWHLKQAARHGSGASWRRPVAVASLVPAHLKATESTS